MTLTPGDHDVFIVVDVQNDFCPGGALEVPDGDAVVPVINRLLGRFRHVVATQDWHTAAHSSFASSHPGRRPFETIDVSYGPQILWPDHCIIASEGAAFHRDLDLDPAQLIIRKGFRREIDSYSAFFENDHKTATGLTGYLRERELSRVFLAGLAFDFCVRFSAEDARAQGFETVVIEDACRGIDLEGSVAATKDRLAELGVRSIQSADID